MFFVLLGASLVAIASESQSGDAINTRSPVARPRSNRPLTKAEIEADLRLEVTWTGPKVIEVGDRLPVSASLVNDSKTTTHPVVKVGDGSELGWREPFVYWTATIDRGDGKPIEVPKQRYRRCGLFDYDWPKDVVALRPFETLPVDVHPLLEFQQAGRVRLQAHYSLP